MAARRKRRRRMRLVRDWLVYLLVRCFVCLVQTLPLDTCQFISQRLAWLACDALGVRRRVVDENLAHVFPDLAPAARRNLARRMWEHLFLMVCEIAHAPRKIHRSNWHRHVSVRRKQELVRYLLDERAAVLVSGHFGNFEMGGYITGLLGFPTFTVARTLDNPFLDRFVNRFRSANGQFIIPKDGSAARIQAVLTAGGALSLLGDQHAGTKGCWVDFLGRPASCHKAIALFTLTTGAPLLVVYARRRDNPLSFEVGLEGVSDPRLRSAELEGVVPLTQWYNRALERVIRASPAQYWWLHRRWKDAPQRRKRAANRAA